MKEQVTTAAFPALSSVRFWILTRARNQRRGNEIDGTSAFSKDFAKLGSINKEISR